MGDFPNQKGKQRIQIEWRSLQNHFCHQRGGQMTGIISHDCRTSGRAGRLLRCHNLGLIVGIHGKWKHEGKSNR